MENESILTSGNILAYANRQASGALTVPDALPARLEWICRTIEKNNRLNNLGRKILIRQLALNIINHCEVRQCIAEDPSIIEESLPSPIFITGLPRTGTSLLHRLMALDEDSRTLKLHEALIPSGSRKPPEYRERYAEIWSLRMKRIMPDTRHMIEMDIQSPIECCFLKRNSLLCHSLGYQSNLGDPEKNWLKRENLAECYDFYKLQLLLIQRQSRAGRWLLKCPSHFPAVEHIYSRFPGAVVICTSRDISEIISSFTSLISTIRSNLSTNLFKDDVALELMHGIQLQMEMHHRSGCSRRTTNIDYADLAANPIGCVSEIYHRNGLHYPAGFEKKMSDWLKKNPRQQNGRHVHAPSMFGLSKKIIHEFFESAAQRIERPNRAEPIN